MVGNWECLFYKLEVSTLFFFGFIFLISSFVHTIHSISATFFSTRHSGFFCLQFRSFPPLGYIQNDRDLYKVAIAFARACGVLSAVRRRDWMDWKRIIGFLSFKVQS